MANPVAYLTNNGISFDGDFDIVNNDLLTIDGSLNVRVEALKDLLKSNYGDYFYLKNLSGNPEMFLGRGVDSNLQLEVENYVKNVIINSSLFDEEEFNIYSITDVNTIYLRIFVLEGTDEETTLDLTYKTETGVYLG